MANAFLSLRYDSLMFSDSVGNILSSWCKPLLVMYFLSISRVFVLSFPFLPTVCFAPVMQIVPFCRLMSATFSHVSSMGLEPKSFDIDKNSAMRVLAFDISMLIFSSVGIFGSLSYLA